METGWGPGCENRGRAVEWLGTQHLEILVLLLLLTSCVSLGNSLNLSEPISYSVWFFFFFFFFFLFSEPPLGGLGVSRWGPAWRRWRPLLPPLRQARDRFCNFSS